MEQDRSPTTSRSPVPTPPSSPFSPSSSTPISPLPSTSRSMPVTSDMSQPFTRGMKRKLSSLNNEEKFNKDMHNLSGYIEEVSDAKRSSTGNSYYDIRLKTSPKAYALVRLMRKTNIGVSRQSFLDKLKKPVMLSNLTKSGETMFYNAYFGSQMVGLSKLPFSMNEVSFYTINEVKSHEKGSFDVCGSIKWISAENTTHTKKLVRDAVIADHTGHIVITFWEDTISQIEEGKCYEVYNVTLKEYFGKKLTTSRTTKLKEHHQAIDIDWTVVEMTDFKKEQDDLKSKTTPTICCPTIFSAKIDIFPTCPTPKCSKKLEKPTDIVKYVKCPFCGSTALPRMLGKGFSGQICVAKEESVKLTVFPEVLNQYFSVDVIKEYSHEPAQLEVEILELSNVDITFSQSRKVILEIKDHQEKDDLIL